MLKPLVRYSMNVHAAVINTRLLNVLQVDLRRHAETQHGALVTAVTITSS